MGHASFHLYYTHIYKTIQPITQCVIVKMLDYLKNVIFNEEKYLGAVEDVKQIHLDGIFI